ncbi:hypothetical protein PGT21_030812 [Puccinia graminis f. sp. tritici]|uniref:Uncharacterized protein n=1 Tax=Puccinia graminis f. sp. tritici TaxID=56615 RepID=A0A5B0N715_PUCGR|nr:hypothetical protein PGT21_030812 [Puccinia graminis f. sp. tritici]KAA1099205.1 hypothetical protein PGTUg99_021709 [Puccinia graminis f. sp. tritici]
MLLKSLCMAFYALNHYMFSSSLAKPFMKRSMGSLGIDGSSSRGKSYFDGPLYEIKELFLFKGEEHSVTVSWYCTPTEVTFEFNGSHRTVPYDEFLKLDESDGVSESDKSTITNALLSSDKGSQASKIKASRNNNISADEKERIWPHGPPHFTKETQTFKSSRDDSKITYTFFHTPVMAKSK